MPVLHHWCLNPSSVYSFVLLLTHTLEVTSSSSNREVISFTTVVVVVAVLRTLLPLARSMVSQNCRVAEYSSCAHAVPVSSRNRLKAGESPCRKPSAEHFSKLHPHQPNQAKWQMFPLSKGKQLASLVSSLFLFLRRTQTFLYCKFTTWVLKKHISQQFHELRLPVSSSYPDRNKLLRPQWYLGFLYKQWRAKSICNLADTGNLPWPVTEDRRQGGLRHHQLQRWAAHPSTYPHRFPGSLLMQEGFWRGCYYSKYILN